tara:strand:+ start:633 stop:797 length:165 start_codon:yes stop_codon:yes gene_type:complete
MSRLDELLTAIAIDDGPEAALAYLEAVPLADAEGRSADLAAVFTARLLAPRENL